MRLHDEGGRVLHLGPVLAKGGEAAVYPVAGAADRVAKVYHAARPEAADKLSWMRDHPPDDPSWRLGHSSIAWPQALVRDARGHVVGFLMPRVRDAVPLLEVLSPRLRAKVLPRFDRRYLHRVARNLTSAVGALHERGYVVGDLNERNVLVTPSALVTLIDTDSFQVQAPQGAQITIYPCPVGRVEYTPPELQGRSLRGVMRHPEHDAFGLAVLVFQLLMAGSHPFRGRWRGRGEPPSIEDKIRKGWFPYVDAAPAALGPPPGTALERLDPALRTLMCRCFVDGYARPAHRPTAAEWEAALAAAEAALVVCGQGHVFGRHEGRCPRCGGRGRAAQPPSRTAAGAGPSAAGGPSTAAGSRGPVADAVRHLKQLGGTASRVGAGVSRALAETAFWGPRAFGRALRGVLSARWSPAAGLGGRLRRARRALRRALLAAVGGLAVAAAGGAAVAWLPQLPAGAGSGRLAALVGGTTLVVVAAFRGLALAVSVGAARTDLVRALAVRALVAGGGWAVGWLAGGALTSTLALAAGPGTASPAGPLALASWLVAWTLYGALGGATGASVGDGARAWLLGGLVFGAVGGLGWRWGWGALMLLVVP